jgi:cation transport protein ChaC
MSRSDSRRLDLTRDLITRAFPHPVEDDPQAIPLQSDSDLAASLAAFLHQHAAEDSELWVFGYGSLMWKPELDAAEHRVAVIRGWHRRFCLWQWRFRGTREKPGLMLALDRGGACKGVAYRIAGPGLPAKLAGLWRREMIGRGYCPAVVTAVTDAGPVKSLTFVANRAGERYAGLIAEAEVAAYISQACGANGPSAEYLRETVARCAELGIHDKALWRLQRMVAERLLQAS